jgi:hypothetical protein
MFKEYDKTIKKILASDGQTDNWEEVLENHTLMIGRIQHERLIHLLVTFFVGIAMLLCVLTTIITEKIYLAYLDFPLIALFLAYIIHYSFLENTTQYWYKIGDELKMKAVNGKCCEKLF